MNVAPSKLSLAASEAHYRHLLSPYELGELPLKNRMVLAPMTRSRAIAGNVPNPIAAAYYAQRAGAGLIVTEATQVSPQGVGYIRTPGIHSEEQVAGWKKITDAVHRAGGTIFLQLWHVGRISHPDFHDGELPVSASAIAATGTVFTAKGPQPMVTPRALELREIPGIVEQFKRGAENAKAAGFDGVELHGANGYLLDQFTRDGTNKRTDTYGGSVKNRARLPLEVTEAVIGVWGPGRVGYRISPNNPFNSMSDSNPVEIFSYLATELDARGVVYLHVVDPVADGGKRISPILQGNFDGTYIVNGGFDAEAADAAIHRGETDLVAFGVPFLANPDLPERYRQKAVLNKPDQNTFYAGEEKGYTDYPALV
ncbi:MAG TPA: alkene reductase [Xanthobacteraceae bacterium]|nr:alkene reductase [Xanthobacteraceae bacterium]